MVHMLNKFSPDLREFPSDTYLLTFALPSTTAGTKKPTLFLFAAKLLATAPLTEDDAGCEDDGANDLDLTPLDSRRGEEGSPRREIPKTGNWKGGRWIGVM